MTVFVRLLGGIESALWYSFLSRVWWGIDLGPRIWEPFSCTTGEEDMAANMAGSMRSPDGLPVEKEQIFRMAQQEMEYRVDLFNKLTQTCFEKCIERKYKESELNVGENSCIDRCVAKYWQVTGIVGQMLGSKQPGM